MASTAVGPIRGLPVQLWAYGAERVANPQFERFGLERFARIYLPTPIRALLDDTPEASATFVEDDNRSAILPDPVLSLDGLPFYLSVKGIGSTIEPFSTRRLDRFAAAEASSDSAVRERLRAAPPAAPDRVITGELWLRGSPYGGQGLLHARTALEVSRRAELTSIQGFRIAPVVFVALLPPLLEERLRSIHWYRTYRDRMVQELRLVPSNVRVYFHAKTTLGEDVGEVFERFGITDPDTALRFEVAFVRTVVPLLTLFARTLRRAPTADRFLGLELQDVWLDKDAVLAPDGSVYFVDLEGIEEVTVDRSEVQERMEDQVYRSLYEFMFAYEQIERHRAERFGGGLGRKGQFGEVVRKALYADPFARVKDGARGLTLEVRNACGASDLNIDFPLLDL